MATRNAEATAPPVMSTLAPNEAPPPYSETGRDGPTYQNEPPPKYEAPPGSEYPQQGYQRLDARAECQSVVVHELVVKFGTDPVAMTCPHCHTYMVTHVEYEAGLLPWLSSGLLCLFGCWMGCCLIPFCIRDLQDAYHRCPQCQRLLGVSRRLD